MRTSESSVPKRNFASVFARSVFPTPVGPRNMKEPSGRFVEDTVQQRRFPRAQKPGNEDLVLFFEYFHGDTGAGLGANHQTGWTSLVADLIAHKNKSY